MRGRFLLLAMVSALGLSWTPAGAQSVLDVASAAGVPPPSTSFFPLSEVHRGLRGTAYTVFEGTQPEAMDVEILGLLHNALGPHQDMILARLHGTKPEYSGVVAGMSGSPVYIDGKLLGALAYRIGEFSKEPIAGITPIGQMLEVRDGAQNSELRAQVASAQRPETGSQDAERGGHSADRHAAGLQRIQSGGGGALEGSRSGTGANAGGGNWRGKQ